MSELLLDAKRLSPGDTSKGAKASFYFIDRELPGIDFNREFVRPGESDKYPDGALVIRVDDDFWIVAVLPLKYEYWPLPKIVETLWPSYAADAACTPDHGTIEQRVYHAEQLAESERRRADRYWKENVLLSDENARLRAQRPAPGERYSARAYASNNYFIRQYEHLLVATAHAFEGRSEEGLRGLCVHCGLSGSNHIHQREWIQRRAKRDADPRSHPLSVQSLCEFDP